MAKGQVYEAELAGRFRAEWGEGPFGWEDRLLYVDIEGWKVIEWDPSTDENERVVDVGERVGCVVPRAEGGLVMAGDTGFSFLEWPSGKKSPIADPEPEKPDNRFNDGKCDPQGRFWAGTISLKKKQGDAALYVLDPDTLKARKILDGVTNSNGICWSPDGETMYYIDTPTKQVRAFEFDGTRGEIADPRVVADTSQLGLEGSPDGMTIDESGQVWVALCHAGMVVCLDPKSGQEVSRVTVPCVETTACAFAGPGLEVLYITTGKKAHKEEEHAGRLFAVDVGVAGLRFAEFGA